ncbi:hypothetical protein [Microbulbifer sp. 2205BS26-8]|uniref:hypothetical protein n=1 Tax=Microbulbifer sp. 2205BS26-8 TaxID=3064386 RepID=UPI00273EF31B|nr:hypothetical protein [Microbulbifer sp. 2205BS26-8]MDP5210010.1 hypothetical protein [Microbulbifer sp. 2205BS26-8]
MKNIVIALFGVFLTYNELYASNNDVIARITGEGGSITVYGPPAGVNTSTTGHYSENFVEYPIVEQPSRPYLGCSTLNERHREISRLKHHECHHGDRCIIFEGYPETETGCPSDREEIVLSHGNNPDAMGFGDWRYLRFYFKVHPDTKVGGQRAIISQVWQHDSTAYGSRPALGPAFAIFLRDHGSDPNKMYVDFTYRNEVSKQNPAVTFHTDTIWKSSWYVYHVKMKARYDGPRGVILLWKNKGLHNKFSLEEAINYSSVYDGNYKFYWGYPPSPENGLQSKFSIRVGIYRPMTDYFTFWMDSIKVTSTPIAMDGI